jgi:hypothetical protein
MTHARVPVRPANYLLPWIAGLFRSASLSHEVGPRLAGNPAPDARQPALQTGAVAEPVGCSAWDAPIAPGLDWWVVAENRAACATGSPVR